MNTYSIQYTIWDNEHDNRVKLKLLQILPYRTYKQLHQLLNTNQNSK